MSVDCFICAKHSELSSIPGGALLSDEHVVISHLPLTTPAGEAESAYLGYLFVEPRRHVAELGELDPDEAAALGKAASAAAEALQTNGAEHVYAAVIGHGVDHLHLHLIARYPDTPREYWWTRVDEWPDAPRGGAEEIAAFMDRLRQKL
jgi:diadenosine tetraphosphate (Ap4A) HIT family hydrolase